MKKTTRIVWAVFDEKARIPNKRYSIPVSSLVGDAVEALLDPADKPYFVGVLDQYKSKWIA